MFEAEYNELALAVDQIAERIRSLGVYAPGSYKQFLALTSLAKRQKSHRRRKWFCNLSKGTKLSRVRPSIFPIAEDGCDEFHNRPAHTTLTGP